MKTTFDYEAFKRGFREAAQKRGIDPERGATEYAATLIAAEMRRDLHYKRLRDLVTAAAHRQFERGTFPSEGRGFLRDDKSLDQAFVDKVQSKHWWLALHPADWKPGKGSSMVEGQALASIRRQIAEQRGAEVMTEEEIRQEECDVAREVIEEGHVQKSQKPLEMSLYI